MSLQLNSENCLMGTLRCIYEKHYKTKLSGYKKKFWVVNEAKGHLEFYKNDQQHVPQGIIPAAEVRGVLYAGDKQDKFYVLIIELRGGRVLKFRMDSVEIRERWCMAITSLVEKHTFNNRLQSVLSAVSRRTLSIASALGVSISIDYAKFSRIPDNVLQYVVEAVDVALSTITVIVRAYGDQVDVPRDYIIHVAVAQSTGCPELCGPQYDPTRKCLILVVSIYHDVLGHVHFQSVETETVIEMLQSEVWRNPLIEGWITTDPVCRAVCTKIEEFLSRRSSFEMTFQWGHDLDDTKLVEEYLMRHVHARFLESVLHAIKTVAAEDDTSTQGTRLHVLMGEAIPTKAKMIADNITGVGIRIERARLQADKAPSLHLLSTAGYERRHNSSFLLVVKYWKAFEVAGAKDESLIAQLHDVVLHTLLTNTLSASRATLKGALECHGRVVFSWEELFRAYKELNLNLQQSDLPHVVSAVTEMYLSRIHYMKQVLCGRGAAHVDEEAPLLATFLRCVNSILVNFVVVSPDRPAKAPPLTVTNGVLNDPLYCCVETHRQRLLFETTLTRTQSEVMNSTMGGSAGQVTQGKATALPRGLCITAAEPRLGSWVVSYFSQPEHCVLAPSDAIQDIEDNFIDVSSVSSGNSLAVSDEFGEMVANERSAETQVLNIHRVVNSIYDSQGKNVDLKIGTEATRAAIRALEAAFPGKHISKHDILRILVMNLRRLRHMYSQQVNGETSTLLTKQEAIQLLRDFCEYKLSEEGIPAYLEEYQSQSASLGRTRIGTDDQMSPSPGAGDGPARPIRGDTAESGSQRDSGTDQPTSPEGSSGAITCLSEGRLRSSGDRPSAGMFNFQDVALVSLTKLLPVEATTARRGWRVGFVAGLGNTGKTLLVNSIKGVVSPTVATVGLAQQVVCFSEWIFAMRELGGRESFRKNWNYYLAQLENVDFVMYVIDSLSKRTYKEAAAYLKELVVHFRHAPFLIVMNNYRGGSRGTPTKSALEAAFGIGKLRQKYGNGRPIIVATCDVTVVHSANRVVPEELKRGLQEVCQFLKANSTEDRLPLLPKSLQMPETL